MHDIYLYGMISPSIVHILDDGFTFPQANGYAEIAQTLPSVGGEAVNSAIILSKLGVKTKLDGNWLNPAKADHVFNLLKPFDIDTSRLTIKPGFGTDETVIADRTSRTVFGNYAAFHNGEKQWNTPKEEDIQHATIAALDPYFKKEALLAAEFCVRHLVPYVTLDCRHDGFMAQQAAAVVISHELRDQAYPGANMEDVFNLFLEHCQGLVIFTFGSSNLWYGRHGQGMREFQPYKIDPVDTTGAGDAFRGAIAYGFLRQWNDRQIIEFASAVAACVCLSYPHTLNAPDLNGMLDFMKQFNVQSP